MAGAVSFHAACRFFSQAVEDVDGLGLLVARLIADRLLEAGAPVVVVADDTLFRRRGRKVHHVFWTHDGAAQGNTPWPAPPQPRRCETRAPPRVL
jgi:hypothetical protein